MMYLMAVTAGLTIFLLVMIRFGEYGRQKDQIVKRIQSVGVAKRNIALDEEMSKPLAERFFKPMVNGLVQGIRKYLPEDKNVSGGSQDSKSAKQKKMLRQAGIKLSVSEFNLVRLVIILGLGILLPLLAVVLGLPTGAILLGAFLGVYCGYVGLRFAVSRRITLRQTEMEKMLPEVLDMLSISVEAGLGFEQALVKVAGHFEGPLIDEIAITNREMTMGRNRKDALLLLGDRCEIEEVKTFVRAIVQAVQLGISMKNVLRAQSVYMRQTRKNKIEEKAMKVSVKILLPMAMFIFPVMFIVLLGPAMYQIAVQFL